MGGYKYESAVITGSKSITITHSYSRSITYTQCGTYLNRSVVSLPENHSALKLLVANTSTNYHYVGYRAVVAKTKMSKIFKRLNGEYM